MTLSVLHTFQSTRAQSTNAELVSKNEWNAEHTLTVGGASLLGATAAGAVAELSFSAVKAALDLEIGTDLQAWDANLDQIAALTPTDSNFIVGNGTAWVAESGATARTSMGVGTGDSPQFTGLTLTGNLAVSSGFVLNIATGNWVATHTSGILTVGTGDLRVTTAGTNTASVVTVGGTQTLTSKTLTSPTVTNPSVSGTVAYASGTIINWDSGDGTLTHSANVLTWDGVAQVFNEAGADLDFRIEGDTNANLFFLDASTDRIGIGTASPGALLDVNGAATVRGILNVNNGTVSGGAITLGTGANSVFDSTSGTLVINSAFFTLNLNGATVFNESGADTDWRMEGDTNANLFFLDASTDRIGIGTNAPNATFEVRNAATMAGGSSGDVLIGRHSTSFPGTATNGYFKLGTNNNDGTNGGLTVYYLASDAYATGIVLNHLGNVGIGTAGAPSVRLDVRGGRTWLSANSEVYALAVAYNATRMGNGQNRWIGATDSATPSMIFSSSGGGAQLMELTDAGNLGIGMTPLGKLDSLGGSTISSTGRGSIGAYGTTTNRGLGIGINETGTMYAWLQAIEHGTAYRDILLNPNGGNVGIGTSPVDKLHVDGNIYLGTSSRTIYTTSSATLTLQTTSGVIQLLTNNGSAIGMYMAGTTGGISFGTATAATISGMGFKEVSYSLGTASSGTVTPDAANGNKQHLTNGGAFTLAPPSASSTIELEITNNGSAGAITTSGFTKVGGDAFTTTNGHKFACCISKTQTYSYLLVTALQ